MNLGSLADLAILVFWEGSKNSVFRDATLKDVPDLSHEKFLRVQVVLREYHPCCSFPQLLRHSPLQLPRYFAYLLGDVEDEAVVELDDSPGTTNGTKFSVLQRV